MILHGISILHVLSITESTRLSSAIIYSKYVGQPYQQNLNKPHPMKRLLCCMTSDRINANFA